ncbi:ferredoxin [Amorphus sp. MBR-141]
MKAVLDQDKCCGAGHCALNAPEVFDQRDEDGVAFLLCDEPPPEQHENVRRAAQLCPALAITITGG